MWCKQRKWSTATRTPSDVSLQTQKFKEDDDDMFAFSVIVFFFFSLSPIAENEETEANTWHESSGLLKQRVAY